MKTRHWSNSSGAWELAFHFQHSHQVTRQCPAAQGREGCCPWASTGTRILIVCVCVEGMLGYVEVGGHIFGVAPLLLPSYAGSFLLPPALSWLALGLPVHSSCWGIRLSGLRIKWPQNWGLRLLPTKPAFWPKNFFWKCVFFFKDLL